MNSVAALKKAVFTSPTVAAMLYAGLVFVFIYVVAMSVADILDQRADVASSVAMLEQLEGRRLPVVRNTSDGAAIPAGSAFLEGATVTVAGANLLQRVAGAVTKRGGNVLSTQVDLQGTQSKAGFLSMIASCDIEQSELQQLLYDIEANMPFLFIDQLVVQSPATGCGFRAMARCKMMRKLAVGVTFLVLSMQGGAALTSATSSDALDANIGDDMPAAKPLLPSAGSPTPVAPVQADVPGSAAAAGRLSSANPLWAVSLKQLSETRDRPIFLPSRRSPRVAIVTEPVAAAALPPPRSKVPERPQLSLAGTIASDDESFAIFLDLSTKAAVRLRIGEDYQGWKLRLIRGRDATLEKNQQTAVLSMPQPGSADGTGEVRLQPRSALPVLLKLDRD
jgi:general secretion pathway protein M